jgi:sarcosine oxidase subunit alpha
LLANGIRRLRVHEEQGTPRGIFCNIGHCMECRVTVDGLPGIRACLTPVREGMVVLSGVRLPTPFLHAGQKEEHS